ncbi:DUF4810 domain-containing protein [Martelella alba]|uniref:DUF4810 domain-containing protein n=1 Tax=Martelella alba TaxID=2590451 RepID=A0ABY2SJ18_9HYPH|nr:DUF4810 domain-containing protein [Martelella alba]TKI04626.1 DUF4810 domain-containing protein [Martelella alba]
MTKTAKNLILAASVLMAGCATAPKKIYHWDKYQTTVYQYYQGGKTSPDEQIASLKASLEETHATAKKVPPGLHAHLGLLYANTGHIDLAFQAFRQEKTLFPEAAPYMDYLMSKNKGGA